jgi:hypothetical protein
MNRSVIAAALLAFAFAPAWAGVEPPAVPMAPASDSAVPCDRQAQPAGCLLRVDLPQKAGRLAYYVSQRPGATTDMPRQALLVLHGYPRDAAHSFNAGLAAVQAAGLRGRVLVVAPLFQVDANDAERCHTPGEMPAQNGDALWHCGSWLAGETSSGTDTISSFAALDALVADVVRQWPGLNTLTLAGFSAGAQMLQRHAAFSAAAPRGIRLRYVIADPGTWLYFDAVRPGLLSEGQPATDAADCERAASHPGAGCTFSLQPPDAATCPRYDRWKYGVAGLPAALGRDPAAARTRYRAAEVTYLAGALDNGPGPGTYDKVLDHSCAAQLQGTYRLQRAQGYAAYERQTLQPLRARSLGVVPGCAHDVGCVLPSAEARPALFDRSP